MTTNRTFAVTATGDVCFPKYGPLTQFNTGDAPGRNPAPLGKCKTL